MKCERCGKEIDRKLIITIGLHGTTGIYIYRICPECANKIKDYITNDVN